MSDVRLKEKSFLFDKLNVSPNGNNIFECISCGACSSRCSWFDSEGGPIPRQIIRMAVLGLEDLLNQSGMLWDCLLCNRCTEICPVGIDMAQIVRRARSNPDAHDLISADMKEGIKSRLEMGDVNGLTKEEFVETIEWMNEEFVDEVEDVTAKIPYDISGSQYLYLPNPRELGMNLPHLMAMAKLFYASGKNWTMSSRHTDVTNWGYFVSNDDVTKEMVKMVVEPAEELKIKTIVLSECGHGYHVLKKLAEKLMKRQPDFEIISMPEFILRYVKKGIIKLDPDVHPYKIAYHDPCNLGRKSGLYEAPRELLSYCCKEVVELEPNRENGICCGGGGGMLQDSTSKMKRMITGKPKVNQIQETGVKNVATACLSCHRQLSELASHFKMEVKVDTVSFLSSESLLL